MVSSIFVAAALSTLSMASAAYYPVPNGTPVYAPAPSGTGSSSPSKQTVAVGQNGLTFTPDTIFAKPGEDIVFEFSPKNHSVVQSDFNSPCNPSEGGIFSGFIATAAGVSNQTFTLTVSDSKPVWLYCAQNKPKPHCAAGMVAVINPPTSGPNTLEAFKELAAKTEGSTVPADGAVSGGVLSSAGSSNGTTTSPPPPQYTGAASAVGVSAALGLVAVCASLLL